MEINFTGRTVLVTGGTKGIGAAIVDDLYESGANVIITGARNEEEIEKLNDLAVHNRENRKKYVHADFSDTTSQNKLFKILDMYEKIDVCVNNAGININNPIEKIRFEDYQSLMLVNLQAPFLITQYFSARMKKEKYGRIVNIASIWSVKTKANRASYTITKSGLVGLTKTCAVELAPYNVLVNAVSPGFTLTELTEKTLKKEEMEELIKIIPINRFAQPAEISKLVLFLASDLNTYIAGQNIVIDGGFTNV